ncbi:DUF3667 domain-containing protein [Chryseobacterium sp. GMJ5]|uniref:DUF3667 domain-containing protein n=1 Tax=Chryseobacterium gilvum TaxID=2976534 RepID=A0ABT2W0H6_9FLAO|nr:DUF3667 domain-containing protein [Chryseobacterium gilvum]MCU7614672.1 DUF3667 domain-containing protein [Chryseobacterium gilvum]
MKITCKNCGHIFEGRYCNHCGQSANTHRIDAQFLWEDIEHGLLHYDKGILYTAKQLFLKPGYVIKDYIAGKRVHHFRPISLAIVLATLYALVYHLTHVNLIVKGSENSEAIFEKIIEHYYWFVFITIPIFALSTSLFFKKAGYNFWEYFIFEALKVSQRLIVHILFLPIILLLNHPSSTDLIIKSLLIVDIALIFWTNLQFFHQFPKFKIFYLTVFSYLLYSFITTVLLILFMLIFFKV